MPLKEGVSMDKAPVRVAIYTRISSEEKAKSENNSLEAQRNICEHYIQIQKEKSWCFSAHYEDPGYSGGNIDRPGLQRLLADVRAHKIDAVIVYKLDRLSRSLKDFYQLWELLESNKVAFASATQSFDTSNSTGKLMLNLLMSFGEFEREQTMERTAARMASRAEKGQWNGGWFPMGYDYDKQNKMLLLNPKDAKIIRKIFDLVGQGCKPAEVKNFLNAQGHRTTARTVVRKGGKVKTVGQQKFDEDHVINTVRNPIFKGFVKHKDKIFPGLHKPIVDEAIWANANKVLETLVSRRAIITHKDDHVHLLKGLVRCGECGYSMTPCPAGKKDKDGNPYLYYSCIALHPEGKDSTCTVRALPARQFEDMIRESLRKLGQNQTLLNSLIKKSNKDSSDVVKKLISKKELLQEEAGKLTQQIRRIIEIMKDSDMLSADVRAEYKRLQDEREKLRLALEKTEINIACLQRKTVDVELIRTTLSQFDTLIQHIPFEGQKELMQLLVKNIAVHPFDPNRDKEPNGVGWFTTRIRTRWYKINLALYEIPTDALNLVGASSENEQIGCGTRTRT